MQVVVQVESGQGLLKLLGSSGMDGVFVREFWDAGSDKERYKIVPLPLDMSLQLARDKATFLGPVCVGVMPCGKGFGVRVLASDFESVSCRSFAPATQNNSWAHDGKYRAYLAVVERNLFWNL